MNALKFVRVLKNDTEQSKINVLCQVKLGETEAEHAIAIFSKSEFKSDVFDQLMKDGQK